MEGITEKGPHGKVHVKEAVRKKKFWVSYSPSWSATTHWRMTLNSGPSPCPIKCLPNSWILLSASQIVGSQIWPLWQLISWWALLHTWLSFLCLYIVYIYISIVYSHSAWLASNLLSGWGHIPLSLGPLSLPRVPLCTNVHCQLHWSKALHRKHWSISRFKQHRLGLQDAFSLKRRKAEAAVPAPNSQRAD